MTNRMAVGNPPSFIHIWAAEVANGEKEQHVDYSAKARCTVAPTQMPAGLSLAHNSGPDYAAMM